MLRVRFIIFVMATTISVSGQVANHPNIGSVNILYKSVQQPTANVNGPKGIWAIPQASVTLPNDSGIVKIHFKMYTKATDSLLYQSGYLLASDPVYNNEAIKVFERINDQIYISPGQAYILRPYRYRIQTEDSLQNLSEAYLIIR